VDEQLSFGGIPFVHCPSTTEPSILVPQTVEILEKLNICFVSFAPDQPIVVQITRPDGSSLWSGELLADGTGGTGWEGSILPGEPLGAYTILATQRAPSHDNLPELLILTDTDALVPTQEEVRATATMQVAAASRPRLDVRPRAGSPGTTFQIYLAGYTPNQHVQLHLYRAGEQSFLYATELSPVPIDGRGEARATLETQPDDPLGAYALDTQPASARFDRAVFRVER
jgi:hypothetical protein